MLAGDCFACFPIPYTDLVVSLAIFKGLAFIRKSYAMVDICLALVNPYAQVSTNGQAVEHIHQMLFRELIGRDNFQVLNAYLIAIFCTSVLCTYIIAQFREFVKRFCEKKLKFFNFFSRFFAKNRTAAAGRGALKILKRIVVSA